MTNSISPKTVHVEPSHILFSWPDGSEQTVSARQLRLSCQCAYCVSEITGQRTLKDDSVAKDVEITAADPTGSYAVSIKFSDNHGSGIYSFEYIKNLI